MLVRTLTITLVIAISSVLAFEIAWAAPQQQTQAQKQPQWKDRAEYDLYAAITKEADPKKALELLNTWKQKYPESEFKEERFRLTIESYRKLNDAKSMMETAKEWLAVNPKSIQALYFINWLTPSLNDTSPSALETSEKAARSLLANVDEFFAPDKKPATTSEADWKKARSDMEAMAHRTLGWVALARKNFKDANAELTQNLKLNPNDAEASAWLSTAIAGEKNPETYPQALFHGARAACYTGPGALEESRRKQMEAWLSKAYTTYHGQDPEGLKELCNVARANAFPPPDFKILSSAEVTALKEKELAEKNPQLAFWLKLKDALIAPNGDQYFESGMKGALVPPENVPPLKGKLVRQEPAKNPKELVLALSEPNTPEVTLKLDEAMVGRAEPGTDLEFRGIPTAFSKEPFMVTFEAEKKNVSGWPAPAPTKKAPPKKGASRKKK